MITSTSNARIKNVVLLQKKAKEREEQGLFVVEGRKMFFEIVRDAPERVREVYASEEFLSEYADKIPNDICVETVSDAVMKVMTETLEPQGIIALVEIPVFPRELLHKENSFWIALENLRDPGNLGTIIRTAEAAGATGVLLSKESVDIYNPKVTRSTMGAIFRVPHFYSKDFYGELAELKKEGAVLFAAHLQGKDYFDHQDYSGKVILLIGNEANGLSDAVSELADRRIRIPMEGKVESLNAAVATALVSYEIYRYKRNN